MPKIVNRVGDKYSFPLELPYISAAMKKKGFSVFTYNLNHHEGNVEDLIKEQIDKNHIDVLITAGTSSQYYPLLQLTETVRAFQPEMPIFLGGGDCR